LTAVVHAADASATPPSDWSFTGSASLVSDYIFRGVSQTQGQPVAQVGMEAAHTSGVYVGTFGSGVSHAAYPNGAGSEIDLYGGWRGDIGAGIGLDTSLVTYWYPKAYTLTAEGKRVRFHTQELHLALNQGSASVGLWYGLSRHWFGFAVDPITGQTESSRGTTYIEANWNPEIAAGWTLNLHAGHQMLNHLAVYNFSDVKLGVTRTDGPWQFALGVTHNTGRTSQNGTALWTFSDADGSGHKVVGTRALASVTRSF
jgi:uncharacterized protein (TIGR02001 family)